VSPMRPVWPISVRALLLLVATCAILFALLASLGNAIDQARRDARRAQGNGNPGFIALALHNYHETYGTFPPAYIADAHRKPMHCWRVLIRPFLEQQTLYTSYNFHEPWDGPNNSRSARTAAAGARRSGEEFFPRGPCPLTE
jgi:hypothetical protein